jgi:hypothetical protein
MFANLERRFLVSVKQSKKPSAVGRAINTQARCLSAPPNTQLYRPLDDAVILHKCLKNNLPSLFLLDIIISKNQNHN